MDMDTTERMDGPQTPQDGSGITGIILAGGKGSRLMPLTATTPKPLLEIRDGYCILDKQLMAMKGIGISNVAILTSHLSDLISKRYGDNWNGIRIKYSNEDTPLGTWGAIKKAVVELGISGQAIITNGDIVTDVPLEKLVEGADCDVTILGVLMRSQYGILNIDDGKVTSFKEKPILPHYINGGIYFVRDISSLVKEFSDFDQAEISIEHDVFPKLASEGRLGVKIEDNTGVLWRSIDSIKDLNEIRELYKTKPDNL